jgi:hypothetical protein
LMLLVMSFLCAWILLQFVLSVIFCLLQHKGLTTYLYIMIIMLQLWVVWAPAAAARESRYG